MNKQITLTFRDELILVAPMPNGDFEITFLDGSKRILNHRNDEDQDVLWFFDDDRDYGLAGEIGRMIDAYLDSRE